jgi:hypothetical protein
MKTLKWFKAGEPIPNDAKFVKSKVVRENIEHHHEHDMLPDTVTWDSVEYFLYEVPIKVCEGSPVEIPLSN